MPFVERKVSGLSELLIQARQIRNDWNPTREATEEIWFRGQARRCDRLVPGIYRDKAVEYGWDETTMFRAFVNLGLSHASQRPNNEWEWYFIAQHHRLPTRLLDWSESLIVACYFALEPAWLALDKRNLGKPVAPGMEPTWDGESPAVWMIDAGSLNYYSQNDECLYAPPRDFLTGYLSTHLSSPRREGWLDASRPIALHAPRQTNRIIAQQGMFTLHGQERAPLDQMAMDDTRLKLACISLDRSCLPTFIDDLILAGIGRLALFPELDSVAEHVKWHYRG